jgi:hypothetical protein
MIHPGLDRRQFLHSVGGAIAAAALHGRPLYGSADSVRVAPLSDGAVDVSFLEETEVLICGSTLFACQLAMDAARQGRRTTLVMDRVNPFFEGISCLRPWLDSADAGFFPAVVRNVLMGPTADEKGGRVYFNASKAALEIEDRLIEAGVRFYYNAAVAGALGSAGRLRGVVFGGKTGFFAVEAGVIVDATLESTVARACGVPFVGVEGERRYHYVVDLAAPVADRAFSFAASNGARVRGETQHYFACFDVELSSDTSGPLSMSRDFDRVYAAVLEAPWQGAEKRFRGADGFLSSGVDRIADDWFDGHAAPGGRAFENLCVFGPKGIRGNADGSLILKDWKSLFAAFPKALEEVDSKLLHRPAKSGAYEFWNRGVAVEKSPDPSMAHRFTDHGFDEPGSEVRRVAFTPPAPAVSSQVLVCGGGTSGNAAAYACAGLGLSTLCVERGYELGGTNTVGGVTNLWFGRKTEAFEEYYKAMGAKNDGLNAPGFYLGIRRAGADLLFGCALTGVAQRGRNVLRAYITTPFGLTSIESAQFIDATGDGAIAAWAGCGYTFGGEHDELTLWASFAGYKPGRPEALRPFLSPCDERSAADATRFIVSMRRNSKISLDQAHVPPPFYLAPRETRHIRCGTQVTFVDLLAGRRFRDGVFRVESNPDIKGLATSDAAKSGLIPTDWKALFRVTVPYSAMIPETLDNVIVAGKAYCASHDALSAARMQRDLCVMGMVAANAVRLCVDENVLLRNVPLKKLQQVLFSKKMLNSDDVSEDDLGFGRTAAELVKKIAATSDMDAALMASAMLSLMPREKVMREVAPYLDSPGLPMQRFLCFIGHPVGIELYRRNVALALEAPTLDQELFGGAGTKHMMPDQGYAPVCALMLGALCHARDAGAVPLLVRLAGRLAFSEEEMRGGWGYYYALACGFERLACAEGVAPLHRVKASVLFQNRVVGRSADVRGCSNVPHERLAYLSMALARALSRCGDQEGALQLCEFLSEARVCLARAARAELAAATGQDYGYDAGLWRSWIRDNGSKLRPNPLTKDFA